MTASKEGIWILWAFDKNGNRTRFIGEDQDAAILDKPRTHYIPAPNDCDGDILFDYMTENDIIESFDDYDTDGDSEYVAIMSKTDKHPDFGCEFVEYASPKQWPSDDCHTYS